MTRPVLVVLAGGTISMDGPLAVPAAEQARFLVGEQARAGVQSELFSLEPSVHRSLDDALELARRVAGIADSGLGVVVTHGTDLLEEVAYLCDLVYSGAAPIVFTGAMRPAAAPGADGPANLADAVVVAGDAACAGLGVLVCFAQEVYSARTVRKVDSTGPAAFGSPGSGPVGRVSEDRLTLHARPTRTERLSVAHVRARVEVVQLGLGSDGAVLAALADAVDGLVVVVPGAGHVPPAVLPALSDLAARVPVVAVARPARGAILRATYGYAGAESDLRSAVWACAGALSPAAARIKLIACLGAALDRSGVAAAFASDDT